VANPVVWCSLASVKSTGAGLPAGPFGLLGEFLSSSRNLKHACACPYSVSSATRTCACTHPRARSCTRSRTHARTHGHTLTHACCGFDTSARTLPPAHAHTRTHTHTHTHTHTSRRSGGRFLPGGCWICVDVTSSENQHGDRPPCRPLGAAWGSRGPVVRICARGLGCLGLAVAGQGLCTQRAAAARLLGVCDRL